MKITFYHAEKNGLDEKLKVYNDLLGKLRNASNEDEYDSICCDVADADPYTELETFTNGFGFILNFFNIDIESGEGNADIKKTKALELIDRCKKVMDDHYKAPRLLPMMQGVEKVKYDNKYYDNVYSCHYWLSRAIDLVTKDDILMVYWRL